jgi:MoxR-like ATPase
MAASRGLAVWRTSLLKGRLPVEGDFANGSGEGVQGTTVWPTAPLFAVVEKAMAELQLPRFVLRHPETASAVLLSLLRMTTQFSKQAAAQVVREEEEKEEKTIEEEDDEEDNHYQWDLVTGQWTASEDKEDLDVPDSSPKDLEMTEAEKEQLASVIVGVEITEQWGGVIVGVQALDRLFGFGHGLLDVEDDDDVGFGLNDGIWQHSGWRLLLALQREIASIPELRDLIHSLGRRPTVEQSNEVRKFVPRKPNELGVLGAQCDPTRRASVSGITLSGSLSEMLPSEAILLAKKKKKHEQWNQDKYSHPDQSSSQQVPRRSPLRRLFLAKMVESKLLSYESSGWEDVPSTNVPRPRHLTRLPSAPGGPILICLDTSWSMTGRREQLSKAVVLACVMAAHKQEREIQVVAFSSVRNVVETGQITSDAMGVRRLLEFLSSSFGGGTDVTGALKHAISVTSAQEVSPKENTARNDSNVISAASRSRGNDINSMAAADILLVTDGEIPDPPVSAAVMEALDRLKQRAGVQVHGLLVGKRESPPLSKLCTHIHKFLVGYEADIPTLARGTPNTYTSQSRTALSSMAISESPMVRHASVCFVARLQKQRCSTFKSMDSGWNRFNRITTKRASLTVLSARMPEYDNEGDWGGRDDRRKKNGGKRIVYDEAVSDDVGKYVYPEDESTVVSTGGRTVVATFSSESYSTQTEEGARLIRESVATALKDQSWQPSSLDQEKSAEDSCWRYRGELKSAIGRIAEGLVERDEEARLVVLAMTSKEHVLFLGPPGTAKSVLGRRLSQICGGFFFQRLLTRFTTPEELFGPLSLRALENDEYQRKTDGFLPTASVAFLDEIFKANSAILNTLLTILNERQFDNGAGAREECPIRCVVGASNELPESDELDALYDRFLLRKEVLPVSDSGLMQMLGMSSPGTSVCDESTMVCDSVFSDDLDRLIKAISIAADRVVLDEDACALLKDLRTFMREELDVNVSDRRLVKGARLLKVSAVCHGRKKVDALDCLLLQHIVWRLPEQKVAVREWLWNHVTPGSSGLSATTIEDESLESAAASSVRQFRMLLDGLRREAVEAVRKTNGDVSGDSGGRKVDVDVIQSIAQEIAQIGDILQKRSSELSRHSELLRRSSDHLWLNPDEAQAAEQLLLPRSQAFLKEVNRALEDARCLEMALSAKEDVANDVRLAVIEFLWDNQGDADLTFSEDALSMNMRDAKAKYDAETFRKWKRARKKANIQ